MCGRGHYRPAAAAADYRKFRKCKIYRSIKVACKFRDKSSQGPTLNFNCRSITKIKLNSAHNRRPAVPDDEHPARLITRAATLPEYTLRRPRRISQSRASSVFKQRISAGDPKAHVPRRSRTLVSRASLFRACARNADGPRLRASFGDLSRTN